MWEWTLFVSAAYLATFLGEPGRPGDKWMPPSAVRAWNTALAVFSIAGALQLAPLALARARGGGQDALCRADDWIDNRWAGLFVWSKVIELGDTLMLVGRGRPVTFLHAYHHSSVLVFSAHAFVTGNPAGFWYMWMNLAVHSVMYSYYSVHPYGRRLAPLITALQMAQMVVGLGISWNALFQCPHGKTSNLLGLGIYASYGFLFARYFWGRYVR